MVTSNPRAVDAPSARTARSAQVTNAAEVEGWFAEWGGPAPLWRMFHDDGTTSFSPKDGTGQAACDHFLDICERQMGLSTCLKLEKFTMGSTSK